MAGRTARALVAAAAATCVSLTSGAASSQETVRLGELEAQTGAINTFGWMSSQGTRLAVDEINKGRRLRSRRQEVRFRSHIRSILAASRARQLCNSER
jgi:ABC-type branched-subunit amino acid transport system substrate-binding protein